MSGALRSSHNALIEESHDNEKEILFLNGRKNSVYKNTSVHVDMA